MATLVSNCASDEYGGAYGGAAGDQTGREYYVRSWYDFGQTAVYRHPNPNVRTLLAQLATEAGENDHIGYDQSQRLTFRNQLRSVGYHPRDISVRCESDCSASTGALIEAVGYLLGDSLLYAFDTTLSTHYMDGPLQAAGFEKLTDSKYTCSGDYLLAGDICLRPASHVNVVVTNGAKSGGSSSGGSSIPESEGFLVTKTIMFKRRMNIRDAPSTTKGKVVSHYEKGSSVVLDGVVFSDGYVWGTYIGATSGKRRYVALGPTSNVEVMP